MTSEYKIENKVFRKVELSYKGIEDRNGIPVGIVEGYIATWDVDRGDGWGVSDQFVKGCFKESIQDHVKEGRPVRLKDHHSRTIGGFPAETVVEDDRGLFARGEVNLEVQQGKEIYMLAKQGVITDFSIGFTSLEDSESDGIRQITKAIIWEGSMVDEPMNPHANIINVKKAVPFQDLPLASKDVEWNAEQADGRVRGWAASKDAPTEEYKNAFLCHNEDVFSDNKLLIADIIDGELKAIPAAIISAAAYLSDLNGERGSVNISDVERKTVINSINNYYSKMDMDSPFEFKITSSTVNKLTKRELEKILQNGNQFTRKGAKIVASFFEVESEKDEIGYKEVALKLNELTDYVKRLKDL